MLRAPVRLSISLVVLTLPFNEDFFYFRFLMFFKSFVTLFYSLLYFVNNMYIIKCEPLQMVTEVLAQKLSLKRGLINFIFILNLQQDFNLNQELIWC